MRLWHQSIISKLPRQQLLGQHRECCALRGKGWGKRHSVVNYVFEHPMEALEDYHAIVMEEMVRRGYKPNPLWWFRGYRGKHLGELVMFGIRANEVIPPRKDKVYFEHNDSYLNECIKNLQGKGIFIIV